jgi:hypothetical protein
LPQTPARVALAKAVEWYRKHGYAPKAPAQERAGGAPRRLRAFFGQTKHETP